MRRAKKEKISGRGERWRGKGTSMCMLSIENPVNVYKGHSRSCRKSDRYNFHSVKRHTVNMRDEFRATSDEKWRNLGTIAEVISMNLFGWFTDNRAFWYQTPLIGRSANCGLSEIPRVTFPLYPKRRRKYAQVRCRKWDRIKMRYSQVCARIVNGLSKFRMISTRRRSSWSMFLRQFLRADCVKRNVDSITRAVITNHETTLNFMNGDNGVESLSVLQLPRNRDRFPRVKYSDRFLRANQNFPYIMCTRCTTMEILEETHARAHTRILVRLQPDILTYHKYIFYWYLNMLYIHIYIYIKYIYMHMLIYR